MSSGKVESELREKQNGAHLEVSGE